MLDLSECEVGDRALQVIAQKARNLCKLDLNSAKESRTGISAQGRPPIPRTVVDIINCVHFIEEQLTISVYS